MSRTKSMPCVLITPPYLQGVDGPYRRVLESAGFEAVYPPKDRSLKDPAALGEQLQGMNAVLASVEPYPREVLASSRLRVIARNGVGYDAIDVCAATELGIAVTTTPGANREAVAEHAVALLLGAAHGFPWRDQEARSGVWERKTLPRLAGRTLGILGLGNIGKEVAIMAAGLGMKVIAHDIAPDYGFAAEHGVRLVGLEELLAESDVLSLHVPATPLTIGLINARTLEKMKRGAILVNTARGSIVDEQALVEALQNGHLAAAALDVFQTEPLPPDSALARLDNVLLSPHIAGLDEESLATMARLAAESIVELHCGRWPDGRVVNAQIREGWKW